MTCIRLDPLKIGWLGEGHPSKWRDDSDNLWREKLGPNSAIVGVLRPVVGNLENTGSSLGSCGGVYDCVPTSGDISPCFEVRTQQSCVLTCFYV